MRSLLIVWLTMLSSLAWAQTATERATQFLLGSADPAGPWGAGRPDTALRDTATVLSTLAEVGRQSEAAYNSGLLWLAEERRRNTDDTARAILALSGTPLDFAASDDRTTLSAARIPGAGWGLGFSDRHSSPLDTALAGHVVFSDVHPLTLIELCNALTAQQRSDGGFGTRDESLVGLTGEVVLFLLKVEQAIGTYYVIAPHIDAALAYLVATQAADGRIGEAPAETALAIRALLTSGRSHQTRVSAALDYLSREQLADGSWESDPYSTAEALLALRAAGPNLSVPSLAFLPSSPAEGDTLEIRVPVRNTGSSAAGAFLVRLFRGSPEAGVPVGTDQLVPGLGAGESHPLSFTLDTTGLSGGQTFTVVVDPTQQVLEASEADNVRRYAVTLAARRRPDLAISLNDIRFTPYRAAMGTPIAMTAEVRNLGDDEVRDVLVRTYDGKPSEGGRLLGSESLATVPAGGSVTTVGISGLTFAQGLYPIYVTVDETQAIPEADEANNSAFRILAITEDVDLVVTSADVFLNPGNQVTEGEPVLVHASVQNRGKVPAREVVLRLALTGQDVLVGDLGPGASQNAVFSLETLGRVGFQPIDVVADPRNLISETIEHNNVGQVFLNVSPRVDLTLAYILPSDASRTVTEGDKVSISPNVLNFGEIVAENVALTVWDGSPSMGGVRLLSNAIVPRVLPAQHGRPGITNWTLALSTTGLAPGVHDLFVAVDPEDAFVESVEANNLLPFTLDVRPKPDLRVSQVTFDPPAPKEGDRVSVSALVGNAKPETLFRSTSASWKVGLYDGSTLLDEKTITGFPAQSPITLEGSIDTTGRLGTNPITVVVDPDRAIPDRDTTNNLHTASLTVGVATTPDPSVAWQDVSVSPARFATGDTVTLSALIHNTRPAEALSVPVAFYLGNPAEGGTLIGQASLPSLPAQGSAPVSISWNTAGVPPGDVAIYAVVDPDNVLSEGSEENNLAARGFEVGRDDSHRPSALVVTPNGPSASLSFTAPPAPTSGIYALRGTDLAHHATVDSPRASATASSFLDTQTPQRAIDGYFSSYWSVSTTSLPHWLEVDLGAKRYVKSIKLWFASASLVAEEFDLEIWDGAVWVQKVQVRGNTVAGADIALPELTKTRKVRLVIRKGASQVSVSEILPIVLDPARTTPFSDTPLLAGTYDYAVTGVDASGIESRPSERVSTEITTVPPPAPLTATVSGNDVSLSIGADASGRRTGLYVLRDGTYLDRTTGETEITHTATLTDSQPFVMTPVSLAMDKDVYTYERPAPRSSSPWIHTLVLPAPRPIVRVDLMYDTARDVTIETWNGTAWVSQVSLPTPSAGVATHRFGPAMTDRVRLVARGVYSSPDGVPRLHELALFARTPLVPSTPGLADTSVSAGSHTYTVVAVDALGQDGAATATVDVASLPQVTGLSATPSGRDVSLSWTALTEPNLAGYRIYRGGESISPPSTTNLATSATPSGSPGSSGAWALANGELSGAWSGYLGTGAEHWAQLTFASPRRIRSVQINWNYYMAFYSFQYRIEAWDGSRWLSQFEETAVPGQGDRSYVFPNTVETDRIRLFLPSQPSGPNVAVHELRIFGEGLATSASFTDSNLPDGTFHYQVSGVDRAGSEGPLSAPAQATLGVATPPTNLTASVSPTGDVSLAWLPSSGTILGYDVYRNGARLTTAPLAATFFTHHVPAQGSYLFEVSAATSASVETTRARAIVTFTDTTPPSAPTGLAFGSSPERISWNPNPAAEEVVGYNVYRADGPLRLEIRAQRLGVTSFVETGSLFGMVRFTYRVTAVDASGLEGPFAEITTTRPVPAAPTSVSATAYETKATVTFQATGAEAYSLKRDGAFVSHERVHTEATASSFTPVGLPSGAVTDPAGRMDTDYWESAPEDATPTLELRGTYNGAPLFPVDRVHLRWMSPKLAPTSFVLRAELFDGTFEDLLTVAGNVPLTADYDLPYRVVRSMRIVSAGGPVAILNCQVYTATRPATTALLDSPAPPGPHVYSVVAVDVAGQRSPDSIAVVARVADVDLVAQSEDIRFSKDTVTPGEAVTLTVSVYNAGTATLAGPASAELYLGDPRSGGTLLGAGSITGLAAGGRQDLSFPWTVTFSDQNLTLLLDRQNAIAERSESNNLALRGAPYTFPHRSYVFTNDKLTPFVYSDDTQLVVRNVKTGQVHFASTLSRGAHPILTLPEGVYHVSGSRKFAVYVGEFDTVGHHALDQESRGASTEFYTVIGHYERGYDHLIVWATEDATEVTVSGTDTNQVYYQGTLNRGQHAWVRDLVQTYFQPVFVHVTANKPVTTLSVTDLGYAAADPRGKFTGTEFHTFVQGKAFCMDRGLFELNLSSYQDHTFVRVTDEDTGRELYAATLGNNQVGSVPYDYFCDDRPHFLHVESSNTVSAEVRPYTFVGGHGPISESGAASDFSGTGIGTRLLEIAQPIGRSYGDFNYVFSYYDRTVVTIKEVARADGRTPLGVIAKTVLNDGEFIDVGRRPDSTGPSPGRLLEVTASHPVTGRFGGNHAAADFMPVLFGAANDPDLEVKSSDIAFSKDSPLLGETITLSATVRNVGVRAAENFLVEIWDGDPARGGRRLHREPVDELLAGSGRAVVEIPYQVEAGFHEIHVLADPEGLLGERDEENNHGKRLLGSQADLTPALVDVLPAKPLVGDEVEVRAQVRNLGGAHVTRADVQLYDGDPAVGGVELDSTSLSLMAGEERQIAFRWDARKATPGAHVLYVRVDSAGIVPEHDEENNVASMDVTLIAPDYDDLVVKSLVLSPAAPFAGTEATAEIVVENRGRLSHANVVRLTLDGATVGEAEVPILYTSDETTLKVRLVAAAPGTHTLVATIDPDASVAEADEANNSLARSFSARDAQLSLTVSPGSTQAGPGADAAMAVALTNRGPARSGALDLALVDAAGTTVSQVASAQVLTLAELGSVSLPFVWNTGRSRSGPYTVLAYYKEGGALVAEGRASLEVVAVAPIRLGIAADRNTYQPGQVAVLTTYVAGDATGNSSLAGVQVVTEIVSAQGTVVFAKAHTVDIAPGFETELFTEWPVAATGPYRARARALEVDAADEFLVVDHDSADLTAAVTVNPSEVVPYKSLEVTAGITNAGASDRLGASLEALLVNGATGEVVASATQIVDLLRASPTQVSFAFATLDSWDIFAPHVAIVTIDHGGEKLGSGRAPWGFADKLPPVITIGGVAQGQCVVPPLVPEISVTDPNSDFTAFFGLDSEGYTPGTPIVAEGPHLLWGGARDAFNETSFELSFVVDGSLPQVAITGVTEGQVAREVAPSILVSDINLTSSTLLLDGAAYVSGSPIVAEGAHTLLVRAEDCAGQVGSQTVHFDIDRTAPVIAVLDVQDGALLASDVTPVVTIADAHPGSSSITLNGAPFVAGTTLAAEGDYTLRVNATDTVGNAAAEVVTSFTIDKTAPQIAISAVSEGQFSPFSVTPTFTVTDRHLSSQGATLDGQPFLSGTAVGEGTHSLVVTALDGAGNSARTSVSFTVDTTKPAISVSGVTDGSFVTAATPVVTFEDVHLQTTTLTLNGAAFVSGTRIDADGAYELLATARDRAGNESRASVRFTVDATAPAIALSGVTDGQCMATAVIPVYSVTDANLERATALLDGASFASGTLVDAEGPHLLSVNAVDKAGNTAAVSRGFTIDRVAPSIGIEGVTDGQASARTLAPTVTVTDSNLISSSALLDGASFVSGTTVGDGAHTLVVTAEDCAGNRAERRVSFLVDTVAPRVSVTGVSDGSFTAAPVTPVVSFADESLESTTLTLNGLAFASGTTVATDGSYVLVASATDRAGNRTEVSVRFVVDATAPAITLSGLEAGACTSAAVTPTFAVEDANLESVVATLDGVPFASGMAISAEGRHELRILATDKAGNRSTAERVFTVDTTAPRLTISGVTEGQFASAAVTPVVSMEDANLTSSAVTLDGLPFLSGTTVSAEGAHTLDVVATDCAGATTRQTVSFTIDTRAPVVAIEGVTDAEFRATVAIVTVTVTDATPTELSLTLDGAAFASGARVSAEGTHTLVATATDRAGNVTRRAVVFTIDTTAPAVSVAGVSDGSCGSAAVTPIFDATDAHLAAVSATGDGAPFVSGTIMADGRHELVVVASDRAGNQTRKSLVFVIDSAVPVVTVAGVQDGQHAATPLTPTVSMSDANLVGSALLLDGAPFVSGTEVRTEGTHVLEASAEDCAGAVTRTTVRFVLDFTAPTVQVSGVVDGEVRPSAITPVVQMSDTNLETTSLTLNGQAFVSGTAVGTDGDYVLEAHATDKAGQVSQVTVRFAVDATAPLITLSGVTDGACTAASVTPVYSVADAHLKSATATLDGAAFASGTPVEIEGAHTLGIEALDAADNRATASARFTIDKTAPEVSLAGIEDGRHYAAAVVTLVSASDANLVSETILLDGAPFVSGTPVASEGAHTLSVSAVDCAGNVSERRVSFLIDRTAPQIEVTGVHDGEITRSMPTPMVTFADVNLASTSLVLDGLPFVSGTPVPGEGEHRLVASATDRAGNVTSVTVVFTIDTRLPVVTIIGVTDGQCTATAVTPTFVADDLHLSVVWATLDLAPFASGTTIDTEGTHSLEVTARDVPGNEAGALARFQIDRTAPVVNVLGVTDGQMSGTSVAPRVEVSEANLVSSQLLLDGAPFVSGSEVAAEGQHELVVSATDCAGQTTEAHLRFTIDRTAPVVSVSGVEDGATYASTVTPVVTVSDAYLASQTLTLDGQPFVSGSDVHGEGNHVLVAAASDRAGHTSTVTVRFTIQAARSDLVVSAPSSARVLLALETSDAPFLRGTLERGGIPYAAVFGREAWLGALRTGLYNVVVVYRPFPSENGTAWPELRENVAAAVGLILIKDHPDAMPKLGPALGGTFAGKRKGATSVTLAGPLGPLTVPMAGDSVRQVATGTAVGRSSKGDVVATLGGLGAGASVTLSWDPERATGEAVRELYLKALAYVTPPEPLLVAGGVVALRARVEASRAAIYRLDLLLPAGVTFVDAMPVADAPGLLRWTVSLLASAVFQVDAWLRLPEQRGIYPVEVEESRDEVRVGSSTQTYAVDASPEELVDLLLARLEALPLVGVDDAARDQAVADLSVVRGLSASSAEVAIARILAAAERVATIGSADTVLIRIDLGRLLRTWQVRSTR